MHHIFCDFPLHGCKRASGGACLNPARLEDRRLLQAGVVRSKSKSKSNRNRNRNRNSNSNTCVVDYLTGRLCWRGYFHPCDAASSIACSIALSVAAASASDLVRSRKLPECQSGLTVGPQRPDHQQDHPPGISPRSLFQRPPASSIKQASNQSSDREPAPPPVLFCSVL